MASKVLSTEQVKIWAETLGIYNLPEDAAEFIAGNVGQKTLAIIDQANRNANRSRRMKILKSDIDFAMQHLNLEPTVDLGVSDYIPIRGVSGVGGKTLYVHDDKDRDVQNNLHLLLRKGVSNVYPDVALRQHWLSLEGRQPAVPENPSPLSKDEQKSKATESKKSTKVTTDRAVRKSQMVCIKELATSDLSAEQQQYYKDVTEAVIGSLEDKRREALVSLEHDPGLHALIPRLAIFISEGVKVNIVGMNLALLIYIMRMAKAMFDNPNLYMEPYLHIITPAVTSCIVSRSLCSRPEFDNHWALRGFAAKTLGSICRLYDSPTNRISQRLTHMFKQSLDESGSSLATRYGGYSALFELGHDAVTTMVIPRIKHEGEALQQVQRTSNDPADKKAVEKIRELLVSRIVEYLGKTKYSPDRIEDHRPEFGPYFVPLLMEQLRDRYKDASKNRAQSAGGTPRLVSPHPIHNMGSPTHRHPAASPGSNFHVMSPLHSMQSPSSGMRTSQSTPSYRPNPPPMFVPNSSQFGHNPHLPANAPADGYSFGSPMFNRSNSQNSNREF